MNTTHRIRNLLLSGVASACVLAIAGGASAASYGGAPIKSPFGNYDTALQLRYEALADMESREGDGSDEWRFWTKAVDAGDGYLVLPDDPASRNLGATDMAFARDAYARLLASYRAGLPGSATTLLADAQVNFDCWLNDTEEGVNLQRARICRARVAEALANLARSTTPVPVASINDTRVAAVSGETGAPASALPVLPVTHRLLFGFDSAELDAEAQAGLDEIVRQTAAYPQATVRVIGHTDRAGDATYNKQLAEERAANVAEALRLRGINLARIDEIPAGESDPAIATPDGVAEPQNRRVEIMIDDR